MALLKNLPNFRIKVSNANWGGQFTHYNWRITFVSLLSLLSLC
jgi:hypothetical protein